VLKGSTTGSSNRKFDMVIQDMNFSHVLTSRKLKGKSLFFINFSNKHPHIAQSYCLTAWTQLETAIELVKAGAQTYLPKPWERRKS